jgi:hypothetical protein
MTPPVDSRLGPGLLKLGAVDYGAQISNVTLEPSQDTEDGTPTLGDPDPAPLITESWVLTGEAIQDWEDAAGFVNYCFDNALAEVAFEFEPDSATPDSSVYAGTCLITSVPIGGDVASQQTSAFEFPVVGTPTRTNPAALSEAAEDRKAREARARRSTLTVRAGTPPKGKSDATKAPGSSSAKG